MKMFLSATFALLLTASSAFAVEQFEGKMKMKITSEGQSQTIDYATKKNRIRFEMPGQDAKMASIMDLDKQEMIMLMSDQKMYMSMPFNTTTVPGAKDAANDTTVEKTSETETILGYKTTKYIVKSKNNPPVEVWAAEGLGYFVNPTAVNPMAGRAPAAWEKELRERGFFPLRMQSKGKKKSEEFSMEVVELSKGSLPDSLFQPPADYQKFAVPGFGGAVPPGKGR